MKSLSKSDKEDLQNLSIDSEDIIKTINEINRHSISTFLTDDPKEFRNVYTTILEHKLKLGDLRPQTHSTVPLRIPVQGSRTLCSMFCFGSDYTGVGRTVSKVRTGEHLSNLGGL